MKLLQTYANSCSVQHTSKPEIVEKYFPLPFEKYITIQTRSGMPAKNYDWFQECVNLLLPILNESNIKIVWLGKKEDEPIPLRNVVDLRDMTTLGQSCYIIKRSMCHLSVDTWSCHFAGAEGVPLVALYGSTTVANHSPYHFNETKTVLMESHRNGNKASFAREENPKTVNLINPEEIVKNICGLISLSFDIEYKTLKIGALYNNRIIESVPDQVVNISNLGISSLIVRMDHFFNENNLLGQLHHCPCSIVTDRPINFDIIKKCRPNVVEIIYNIKKNPKPNASFIKSLFDTKVPYRLVSFLPDDEIKKFKLDFMDWGIIDVKESQRPEEIKGELGSFFYKTNKFLLSNGKIYQSFYDYKNGRPIPHLESTEQKIIGENLDYLWFDKDCSYFSIKT